MVVLKTNIFLNHPQKRGLPAGKRNLALLAKESSDQPVQATLSIGSLTVYS